ncbi:hypothetical protein CFOL_v3_13103 [Cephalotus follicularis]|uniref:DNA-directed RNA polymerase subunit n=1 Tax=Cephalotus follicularis TaxID=3775 RepID=A0A1Q3BP17_CEPFO|nr:hypothetical protein CFOL_v3_13103 [Cephalotus follicularis]
MFSEVKLIRSVAIIAENLDKDGPVGQRSIVTRLLEDLQSEKASKDHGYFLAVTSLNGILKVEVVEESRAMFFVVLFNCRTFKPFKGEVLQGVVHHIFMHGVFLRCGPVKYVFLSARKMPNYHYVSNENPVFLSDELAKIEKDVVVRFMVLGVKWIEQRGDMKREFVMLASLEGESLGPISLSGSDELDV